ncbi:MAG TPA: SpoIID/LytB domain-containing protein [Thermoleophilaceae bacterium]|nr:SpoIID/LytB domain-containing protein [Thermoleophilaceae bacterium]
MLAVALAAPAHAYTIRGHGFGHGVGMSQYGALGLARHGVGYRDILAHYFKHTRVEKRPGRTIRVLLLAGYRTIDFSGATSAGGRTLDPAKTYTATLVGSRIALHRGKRVATLPYPLLVLSARGSVRLGGTAINGVTDGAYRGALELRPTSTGGLTAINQLPVDAYVRGVVPGEVPARWPADALKAQAVAARSYALTTHSGGDLFDQYPDTRSQVYRGMDAELPRSSGAVIATANEVVTHDGEIATTFFSSSSGGRTENVENSFGGAEPKPYLKSVKDPYDGAAPRHKWRIEYSRAEVTRRLAGLVKGRFRGIRVVDRGESPRIVWADVVGSGGTTRVSGATLKYRLALNDTWARFPAFGSKREKAIAALPIPLLAPVAPETAAPPPPPKPEPEPKLEWPPSPL